MESQTHNRLKPWETAFLMALTITLLLGAWAQKRQSRLEAGLVRLHVIAVSDSAQEQSIKLDVRDAVLRYVAPMLQNAETVQDASKILNQALPDIRAAAGAAAQGRRVSVALGQEHYPVRYYDGFTLPAGKYTSLRITLGEGGGKNWWCVVFPPLCTELYRQQADTAPCLSDEDIRIITEDGDGYVLKFKILELWGELRSYLSRN